MVISTVLKPVCFRHFIRSRQCMIKILRACGIHAFFYDDLVLVSISLLFIFFLLFSFIFLFILFPHFLFLFFFPFTFFSFTFFSFPFYLSLFYLSLLFFPLQVYIVVDPLSLSGQRASSIITLLTDHLKIPVTLVLIPLPIVSDYPLQNFYRSLLISNENSR